MINNRSIAEMARRWRRAAALVTVDGDGHCQATLAGRGHFVVYTSEGRRHELPLAHLNTSIFRELLRWSEDEYGLPKDGPITLACDGAFMEHVLKLLKRRVSKEDERAVVVSIARGRAMHRAVFDDVSSAGGLRPEAAARCSWILRRRVECADRTAAI